MRSESVAEESDPNDYLVDHTIIQVQRQRQRCSADVRHWMPAGLTPPCAAIRRQYLMSPEWQFVTYFGQNSEAADAAKRIATEVRRYQREHEPQAAKA